MPPYLDSAESLAAFLADFDAGRIPRAEWNHAAHLAFAAAAIQQGAGMDEIRARILHYASIQGIESTPDSGYHETLTRFWVDRLSALTAALGRGATALDAARAAVAAFAHRPRLFDAYYTFDLVASREARALYLPPDK